MSVESRIRALTRAQSNRDRQLSKRYRKADEAVDRGTATMDQYRLLYASIVHAWRAGVALSAVFFVTLARLDKGDNFWPAAIGYPPDVALPNSVQDAISKLQAKATNKEKESSNRNLRQLRLMSASDAPERRLMDACHLLTLGDLHGMALRRQVWRIEGAKWVLSDEALSAAEEQVLPAEEVDRQLGLGGQVTRGVESGDIAVGPDGIYLAEFDRAAVDLGWQGDHGPSSWSDQVTSGQPKDHELCKDLDFGVHVIGCPETYRR